MSFLHRFGSSLNTHFHYHVVVLDGVFSETEEGGVEFHEASEPEPAFEFDQSLPDSVDG